MLLTLHCRGDVVHTYSEILVRHYKECSHTICSSMERPGDDDTKWSESDKDKYDIVITYMWNLKITQMNLYIK